MVGVLLAVRRCRCRLRNDLAFDLSPRSLRTRGLQVVRLVVERAPKQEVVSDHLVLVGHFVVRQPGSSLVMIVVLRCRPRLGLAVAVTIPSVAVPEIQEALRQLRYWETLPLQLHACLAGGR